MVCKSAIEDVLIKPMEERNKEGGEVDGEVALRRKFVLMAQLGDEVDC